MPTSRQMVDYMFDLCVYHFWVGFKPIFKDGKCFTVFELFFLLQGQKKLKVPSYQGRWSQIKNAIKQTSFKIQFYIGIKATNFFPAIFKFSESKWIGPKIKEVDLTTKSNRFQMARWFMGSRWSLRIGLVSLKSLGPVKHGKRYLV